MAESSPGPKPARILVCLKASAVPEAVRQALTRFAADPSTRVIADATLERIQALVKASLPTIVLLAVSDRDDLVAAAAALVALKGPDHVRLLALNGVPSPKVPPLLRSKGCHLVLEARTNAKALQYRLQSLFETLEGAASAAAGAGRGRRLSDGAGSANAYANAPRFGWETPLAHVEDCWLLMQKRDVERTEEGWRLVLRGPPPTELSWAPLMSDVPAWGAALPSGASWEFQGEEPLYLAEAASWRFSGPAARLTLVSQGQRIERFGPGAQGQLKIARNSRFADERLGGAAAQAAAKRRAANEAADATEVAWNDRIKAEAAREGEIRDGLTDDADAPEWNDQLGDDEAAAEWNQSSAANPDAPDYNGDARRENQFNSGAGLGQGQAGGPQGYGYDQPSPTARIRREELDADWASHLSMDDMFSRLEVTVELIARNADGAPEPRPIELAMIERDESVILLDVAMGQLRMNQTPVLAITLLQAGVELRRFKVVAKVESYEALEDARVMVGVRLPTEASAILEEIDVAFANRTAQVEHFMMAARGR